VYEELKKQLEVTPANPGILKWCNLVECLGINLNTEGPDIGINLTNAEGPDLPK
jgi:hypothetical protein